MPISGTLRQLQGRKTSRVPFCIHFYVTIMTTVAAITMLPVFYTQSTALAILIYLVLPLDPVNIVVQIFSTKEIVMNLHLTALTFSSVNNTFFTQLSLRNALPQIKPA